MNKRFKLTSKNGKILMYVSSLLFLSFIILFLHGCGDRKTEFPDSLVPEPTSVIESIPSEESDGKIKDNISDSAEEEDLNPFSLVLTFAGDINFDENWSTMKYYNSVENGIYDCISPELIQIMRNADIMCLNNEFTYSNGGSPLENKAYTFRANPSRVEILKELGVDIVSLANNHAYDYGEQSLVDTMAVLNQAGIKYVGAGHNIEEAMSPVYFEIQGKTIAYVAASRAEKYRLTPQATEDEPGILLCYDTELFIQAIKEAKQNAEYVIAYVHWGTEYSYELEEVQLITGKEYLDAGADIVIGAHPHCLQGIEYYEGKPIVYSLGNFWFNDKTLDTMLLNVHVYGDDMEKYVELEIIPAIQTNNTTLIVNEQSERQRIFSFLESISINVEIDDDGFVSEKAN
ncbi:MAG: CapA family protein [Clostridiales bacterium]|jgi:poly-gamma-glutamate synthesis protein (capsule biosynthesis protein)|nr:CapA family protein [Clostridiales bacterium]